MQKLYYFVDETGQDTLAQLGKLRVLFVVGVVITDTDPSELERLCIRYEKSSGKRATPWHKTKYSLRLNFLRSVFTDARFAHTLFYQLFEKPSRKFFDTYIIQSIANVIGTEQKQRTFVKEIYVDGLTRTMQPIYSVELRRLGVEKASFHRATDQGNALIRLADALAGLVRDALEDDQSEAARILRRGKLKGVITELETKNHPKGGSLR